MNSRTQRLQAITRRYFLERAPLAFGALALAQWARPGAAQAAAPAPPQSPLAPRTPPLPARAKHVIYLHMEGSPPQQDLFDCKPALVKHNMEPCPDELLEVLKQERLAFIDLNQRRPQLLGSPHQFAPCGQSGMLISELLPEFGQCADDICLIRSFHTDQFNHAPAELLLHTGAPRFGNASIGSWVTYGLGSESEDLPGFVVLVSGGTDPTGGKSLWGSGFLPSVYQGVQCRTQGEPILFVDDPPGMSRALRRRSLDALRALNDIEFAATGDPETQTRISQYELAYRMQTAVPELLDIAREPPEVLAAYGCAPGQELFANNCLLARRLVEHGVRYVQLFDYGWDMHGTGQDNDLVTGLPKKCREMDRPLAALIRDLKERGLFDETLLIWSGEFGRTSLNEARHNSPYLGRDHHPHCASIWLAGAGIRRGVTLGETDELGYFITENKIGVRDLQATILHLLGLDPLRFTFPYQGLQQRLIGPTDEARILHEVLS
ncbi:MAG: DUF1501 domain-containing protein [Pirellulaceae bacterium]|jgi:hypothetical protein|nr:DUF1501 domain-containing protein [Pirellulaceae bacterium]